MSDERHVAGVRIEVNGRRIEDLGLAIRIHDLEVRQRDDRIDDMKLELIIDDVSEAADVVFDELNVFDVYLTYTDDEVYLGRYFNYSPSPKYSDSSGRVIVLNCLGEDTILDRAERRRSFVNKKDSEIALAIAKFHGLDPIVSDTVKTYPRTQQVNLTDWMFLKQRAGLYGYTVKVRAGFLYFGPRRESLIEGNFAYGDNDSLVDLVHAMPSLHRSAMPLQASAYNPITRSIVSAAYNGEETSLMTFLKQGTVEREMTSVFELANGKGVQADFRVVDTHLGTAEEINGLVLAKAERDVMANRVMIRMRAITKDILPGSSILITGIPPHSAQYYIREVHTRFHARGNKAAEMTVFAETWLTNNRVEVLEKPIDGNLVDANTIVPITPVDEVTV